ncbi:MAG: metal ABC transporter permease [Solirubrobacteraceae bacterium]
MNQPTAQGRDLPVDAILHALVEPGFFSTSSVRLALAISGVVAIVAGTIGFFTVVRGQAFAGEALGDIGIAGGSSAYLAGIGAIWGFLAMAVAGATVMELIGVQRARGRDMATGIVLGVGFGLAALLLYLETIYRNTTGAVVTVLSGSPFTQDPAYLPIVAALAVITLVIVITLYRPLLLASLSPELAAAHGVPVRLMSAVYLIGLAVAVALSALTIGAILSTALLIGPAATALRLTRKPSQAVLAAAGIGLLCTWLGLLLSYDSFYWPPLRHGWPASFFIVTLIMIAYLVSGRFGRRAPQPTLITAPAVSAVPSRAQEG